MVEEKLEEKLEERCMMTEEQLEKFVPELCKMQDFSVDEVADSDLEEITKFGIRLKEFDVIVLELQKDGVLDSAAISLILCFNAHEAVNGGNNELATKLISRAEYVLEGMKWHK